MKKLIKIAVNFENYTSIKPDNQIFTFIQKKLSKSDSE